MKINKISFSLFKFDSIPFNLKIKISHLLERTFLFVKTSINNSLKQSEIKIFKLKEDKF